MFSVGDPVLALEQLGTAYGAHVARGTTGKVVSRSADADGSSLLVIDFESVFGAVRLEAVSEGSVGHPAAANAQSQAAVPVSDRTAATPVSSAGSQPAQAGGAARPAGAKSVRIPPFVYSLFGSFHGGGQTRYQWSKVKIALWAAVLVAVPIIAVSVSGGSGPKDAAASVPSAATSVQARAAATASVSAEPSPSPSAVPSPMPTGAPPSVLDSVSNPPTAAPAAPSVHHVQVGHFLHRRSVPDGNAESLGTVNGGEAVTVECQMSGDRVTDPATNVFTTVWDRLDDGSYITDLWVDTNKSLTDAGADKFDSNLPVC